MGLVTSQEEEDISLFFFSLCHLLPLSLPFSFSLSLFLLPPLDPLICIRWTNAMWRHGEKTDICKTGRVLTGLTSPYKEPNPLPSWSLTSQYLELREINLFFKPSRLIYWYYSPKWLGQQVWQWHKLSSCRGHMEAFCLTFLIFFEISILTPINPVITVNWFVNGCD